MRTTNLRMAHLAPIALALGLAAGCGGEPEDETHAAAPIAAVPAPPAKPLVTEAARHRAQTAFDTICVACHGSTGKGDGPGAAGLDPKPRAFGDKAWQKSVTDEHIEKVIVYGGAAVGKSPNMPANPMYKDNAPMRAALREIVRKFGEGQ